MGEVATAGDHHYERALAGEGAWPRQRMVRVGKEAAGLAADLPLDPRSSVFVRVGEQQVVLWKALITGAPHPRSFLPTGAGGCG